MKRYAKNIDDRKLLVARLSELTGLNSRYTFVPRCAYEVGALAGHEGDQDTERSE